MMDRKLVLAAALVIGFATQAQAAVEDRMYVSGLAQYVLFDDARALENGFGGQLGLGFPLTDSITVELDYLIRGSDLRAGGSFDQSGYGVDGLFFFDHDGAMDPYLALGFGRHSDDYGPATDDYSSLSVGLGLIDAINDNFGFRGEVRVHRGEDVNTATDIALSMGLVYYFGEPSRQMAPVMAERDSDDDGVLDSRDRCPGSALGSKVDLGGCTVVVAAAVAAPAVVVDGDADGDGVKDSVDRCPGTPAGTKVLADGCAVPTVLKLEGVTFETNSDQITAGSKAKLDEAVVTLKANPTVQVEVAGHTDDVGDADVNRRLSQRRADAVRKHLVDGGVATDQVSARGYGEDDPVAGNDSDAGRAQNRRVELRVKQ